jgi:hypothetical protein
MPRLIIFIISLFLVVTSLWIFNFKPSGINKIRSYTPVKRLALVIGNADYKRQPKLIHPLNDAKDMATELKKLGYEVILKLNINQEDMKISVLEFGAKLLYQGGAGLFYFSGYATQDKDQNYLVPIDGNNANRFNINNVLTQMEQARNQINIMILDVPSIGALPATRSTLIAFANAPSTSINNSADERNSLYTKYWLAALRDKPQWPVTDLLMAVRYQVMDETKQFKVQQVPWESSAMMGKFCFRKCVNKTNDFKLKLAQLELQEAKKQVQELSQQQAELKKQLPKKLSSIMVLDKSDKIIDTLLPDDEDPMNFAAFFKPTREMFEDKKQFQARRQKLLDQFNQAVVSRDRRYQAGIVHLQNYDADRKRLSVKINWQASWVKKFFGILPEYGTIIKLSTTDAEAVWKNGRRKPLFIKVDYNSGNLKVAGLLIEDKHKWVINLPPILPNRELPKIEVLRIPAGKFQMATDYQVVVKSFTISSHEITFDEYDYFAEATGREKPSDNGWGRGNRPVTNVDWEDANAYVDWLSQVTGDHYRLPTEAEWEYAARAGTSTNYWWGNNIGINRANCRGCGSKWDGKKTAPVGSFQPNAFGLYDTVGNIWEWTCSKYEKKYNGAEQQCLDENSSEERAFRGGAWHDSPKMAKVSARGVDGWFILVRGDVLGFRVVRE